MVKARLYRRALEVYLHFIGDDDVWVEDSEGEGLGDKEPDLLAVVGFIADGEVQTQGQFQILVVIWQEKGAVDDWGIEDFPSD